MYISEQRLSRKKPFHSDEVFSSSREHNNTNVYILNSLKISEAKMVELKETHRLFCQIF